MTEKDFQEKYNLTDEDLADIKEICLMFDGKIISIKDSR